MKRYWGEAQRNSVKHALTTGNLDEFEPICQKYIKERDKLILEAGCGVGYYVAAFQQRGFNIHGVDYEPNVIEFIKSSFPELVVELWNILRLDCQDESIDYYLSFGVVEYFEDGPNRALMEAYRVLKQDGIALISVPYLNP